MEKLGLVESVWLPLGCDSIMIFGEFSMREWIEEKDKKNEAEKGKFILKKQNQGKSIKRI